MVLLQVCIMEKTHFWNLKKRAIHAKFCTGFFFVNFRLRRIELDYVHTTNLQQELAEFSLVVNKEVSQQPFICSAWCINKRDEWKETKQRQMTLINITHVQFDQNYWKLF